MREVLEIFRDRLGLSRTPESMQEVYVLLRETVSDEQLAAWVDDYASSEDSPMMRLTAHRTEAVMVDHNAFTQPKIMHAIARAARGEAYQYKTRWVVSCSLSDARTVGAALQYLWAGNVEPAIEFISRNNQER